jgi:uncharacterized protein YbjT (DUF2867 family)
MTETATTVAIAGASGVVGRRVLARLLERADVATVVAVGRRELDTHHEKLTSRVADLKDPDATAAALPAPVSVGICCLGTTLKAAGSKEAFRAVDHDAVVAFGRAVLRNGGQRLVLVSSIGADASASGFYLRTKGEAERALADLAPPQLTILRPSFIDDEGARSESRPLERISLPIAHAIFSVLGRRRRYAPISAETIARALVRLAFDETSEAVRVVESDRLHVLGG